MSILWGYFCTEHRLSENHECPNLEHARVPSGDNTSTWIQQKTLRAESPYEYAVTYYIPVERKKGFYFSSKEIAHLTVAALLVAGIGFSFGISQHFRAKLGEPLMLFILSLIHI